MDYLHYLFTDSRIFVRRSLPTMTSSKTAPRSSDAAISNAQIAEA
ncbi:hypothetical protein [Dictyobacter aurantiacus]|uniref:Uncharacterized protein n=1 Tax=Dictyobacter aurantiacus TaxID=1936993 RepID=A0A401ZAC1_9CHLR|nr:hypothetical protein [Dictyobacter aurantiacus]GCE03773.1 hypothetical protein KDAU_11020 [Dictyobacter aurantiacus]